MFISKKQKHASGLQQLKALDARSLQSGQPCSVSVSGRSPICEVVRITSLWEATGQTPACPTWADAIQKSTEEPLGWSDWFASVVITIKPGYWDKQKNKQINCRNFTDEPLTICIRTVGWVHNGVCRQWACFLSLHSQSTCSCSIGPGHFPMSTLALLRWMAFLEDPTLRKGTCCAQTTGVQCKRCHMIQTCRLYGMHKITTKQQNHILFVITLKILIYSKHMKMKNNQFKRNR